MRLRPSISATIGHVVRGPVQGIALIIVMISIFVLTVLAGGFALFIKVETKLARSANSQAELEWLGRSAVECARWELAQQLLIPEEPYDSLDQVWAGGTGSLATNSPLMDWKNELQLKNLRTGEAYGSATWTIVDLERYANLNAGNEAFLNQALTVMGLDAGQATPVVNSILDWLDPDENPRIQGAESDFYQGLNPPYYSKNGPIDDLSELLLIKSVREMPELYWGISVTNYQPGGLSPMAGRFNSGVAMPPVVTVGFTNLFTALSDGRINLNTASAEVLEMIPGMNPEMAQAVVAARTGEPDPAGLSGPFRNLSPSYLTQRVPPLGAIPGMAMANQLAQYCDIRSRTFEVHVAAQVNGAKRNFVGVLGRTSPRDVQILSFYWTD